MVLVSMLNLEHSPYTLPIDAHALQNDLIPVPVTYRSEKIRGAIAQKHKPLITQYIVYNRQPKTVDSAQYLGV